MLLGVLTPAYWVLRDRALQGSAFPGRPYVVGWSAPDFVAFLLGKLAYSLIGLFGFVPALPGGAMGRLTRDLNGGDWTIRQGQRIRYDLFEVTIAQVAPDGVQELIFDFDKPLDSPEYHFYLGSRQRLACELDMAWPLPANASAGQDTSGATQNPRAATALDRD